MATVLVVDDDRHIREVVRFALEKAGHRVVEAADGLRGLALARAGGVDVIVLDVLMPELDGLEVCRELRKEKQTPILFLSSRDDELDRVLGLELGADDYVTKPFSPRELVARVKVMLRRLAPTAPGKEPSVLAHGKLKVDVPGHRCFLDGTPLVLTVTEFSLVEALLRAPGKVFTRDELVERAWGSDHHITERTIDSHVRRIRQKFGKLGDDPIETVYGLGYRLRETPA